MVAGHHRGLLWHLGLVICAAWLLVWRRSPQQVGVPSEARNPIVVCQFLTEVQAQGIARKSILHSLASHLGVHPDGIVVGQVQVPLWVGPQEDVPNGAETSHDAHPKES